MEINGKVREKAGIAPDGYINVKELKTMLECAVDDKKIDATLAAWLLDLGEEINYKTKELWKEISAQVERMNKIEETLVNHRHNFKTKYSGKAEV
jgi:hypothetical protein